MRIFNLVIQKINLSKALHPSYIFLIVKKNKENTRRAFKHFDDIPHGIRCYKNAHDPNGCWLISIV